MHAELVFAYIQSSSTTSKTAIESITCYIILKKTSSKRRCMAFFFCAYTSCICCFLFFSHTVTQKRWRKEIVYRIVRGVAALGSAFWWRIPSTVLGGWWQTRCNPYIYRKRRIRTGLLSHCDDATWGQIDRPIYNNTDPPPPPPPFGNSWHNRRFVSSLEITLYIQFDFYISENYCGVQCCLYYYHYLHTYTHTHTEGVFAYFLFLYFLGAILRICLWIESCHIWVDHFNFQ